MFTAAVSAAFLLCTRPATGQISEDVQSNLKRIALDTLNSSESIVEIAHASDLLLEVDSNAASDTNFKSVTCKRVAKMLYHEDLQSESQHMPSMVLAKATVYRNLGCETLGGVTSQIDAIVGLAPGMPLSMESLSMGELYAAYMLYSEADGFGAKSPPSEKLNDLLAEKALNDWLINFKAEKWTYREVHSETIEDETIEKFVIRELDIPMLQMTEMLASLVPKKKSLKQDIQFKLNSAFTVLMDQAYPDNGRFFLSKRPNEIDSAELTYHALRAIKLFNAGSPETKVLGLKKRALIDYFMTKTSAASHSQNLRQALVSIKAAQTIINTNSMPFTRVVVGETQMIGDSNGSVTVQFLNILGNPIGVKGRKLTAAKLFYFGAGNDAVDALSVSTFDENAGKATIKIGKLTDGSLRRGAFYP